ncbi:hypothetical protein FACS189429_4670 [Bacteroidia bacterium]|nr:hypothetical protein FACS189429_4670 [Bacteroidia bacterium]GHV43811.1 hypothetical protein FACS1894180_4030 [Bacteroidia bacterium]
MKVYHGSYIKIDSIDFSFCRKKRDFGKGFYVTKLLSQAEYWAARKGEDNDTEGVVTEFEFEESAFEDEDFRVLRFDGYNAEWLDFIVKNRTNKKATHTHDYDIIEGPVADDDIATKVYDYIKKNITQKQFLNDLTHRKPSHQICFCTLRSLQALEQDKAYIDSPEFHIGKKIVEQLMLDNKIDEVQATDLFYNSKTFEKLSDETTKFYQKSWQEIYEMLKKEL